MYVSPKLNRFGTMQELTQAGCNGSSDGATFAGATSIGNTPIITGGVTSYCFASPVS